MVSAKIRLKTVLTALSLVIVIEMLGAWISGLTRFDRLAVLAVMRVLQTAAIVWAVRHWEGGLSPVGWAPASWIPGVKKGVVWSLIFAAVVAVSMGAVYLAGGNPLQLVRSPLPPTPLGLGLYFLVGGAIAPVWEELCFRGLLYTFFRRWGIAAAMLASTAIFVGLHAFRGIPYPQIVGGIVFAAAYETSGNLTVPITIHCLGNLAIFSLSLI